MAPTSVGCRGMGTKVGAALTLRRAAPVYSRKGVNIVIL
jgi:hypothetical protein